MKSIFQQSLKSSLKHPKVSIIKPVRYFSEFTFKKPEQIKSMLENKWENQPRQFDSYTVYDDKIPFFLETQQQKKKVKIWAKRALFVGLIGLGYVGPAGIYVSQDLFWVDYCIAALGSLSFGLTEYVMQKANAKIGDDLRQIQQNTNMSSVSFYVGGYEVEHSKTYYISDLTVVQEEGDTFTIYGEDEQNQSSNLWQININLNDDKYQQQKIEEDPIFFEVAEGEHIPIRNKMLLDYIIWGQMEDVFEFRYKKVDKNQQE